MSSLLPPSLRSPLAGLALAAVAASSLAVPALTEAAAAATTSGALPVAGVTASAHDGNVPANAVDGSLTTRWSAAGDGQYLTADLGQPALVDGLALAWHDGNRRRAEFSVSVSPDGERWQTVLARTSSSGTTLELERFGFAPIEARFVRLTGHGNNLNAWNSLTELEVLGAAVPTPTAGRLPVAGVTATSHDGNVPANAVDGSLSTRWSALGDGEQLTADLGTLATVDAVELAWHSGDRRRAVFSLEVSVDGDTWHTVLARTRASGTTLQLERHALAPVEARFVRLTGHGNNLNAWNAVTELEVHGTPVVWKRALRPVAGVQWGQHEDGHRFTVDLGTVTTVDEVALTWQGGTPAGTFSLATSTDADDWTPVVTTTDVVPARAETYRFDTVSARYVQVTADGPALDTWTAIADVVVSGRDRARTASAVPQPLGPQDGDADAPASSDAWSPAATDVPAQGPVPDVLLDPEAHGFPGPTTTGAADVDELRVVEGRVNVDRDGQVLENVLVRGRINVTAANATIRNVRVEASSEYGIVIDHRNGGRHLTVLDTEIVGRGESCIAGIAHHSFTARRVEVTNCDDGFRIGTDTTIEDSFVHGLRKSKGDEHNDAMQTTGGRNIVIRNNTMISVWRRQTSSILLQAIFSPIDNVLVEGNLMSGGTYTIYVENANDQPGPTNVTIRDNVLVEGSGLYGHRRFRNAQVRWEGNVFSTGGRAD
ncbi:discoidin domain-containing protein [Egicoccus halophilus]|uniref:F5/8 type C domain-containing protein n=1 Tax=Egicoccus halophilus TaxID=1670830 RepID=A0A8J3ESY0_9ACTN|nr:discoidin domain-containing protein [Egicoccus halophilus]GGI08382.1 hypothetical protein GCM10011354_28810 [Egicoccus halophilus]